MNYKKVYDNIIQNRLNTPLSVGEYGENHHILPRSLGGSDKRENIVRLTAREHFICHALLAEMYERETFEWHKMNHAFMAMKAANDAQKRYFNSRLYELKRKDFSKVISKANGGENSPYYETIYIYNETSKETRRIHKDSLIPKGWLQGRINVFSAEGRQRLKDNNPKYWKGKLFSDEHKQNMSTVKKGENNSFFGKNHTVESKHRQSKIKQGEHNPMFGKHHTYESKEKMKNAALNRLKVEVECPKCHKTLDIGNAKRWHFDKCKYINN
jgi:hypothetical protein